MPDEMQNKKIDRRVRKTRAQLKDGLIRLLKGKSIQEITVHELVDEVDINRSTFYLHYTDIFDMLKKVEDEFFTSCMTLVEKYDVPETDEPDLQAFAESPAILTALYQIVKENADFCLILMGPNGDIQFVNKVIATIDAQIKQRVSRVIEIHNQQSEYIYDYCMYGCIGLIKRWLAQGAAESPEEMARLTAKLLVADLNYLN